MHKHVYLITNVFITAIVSKTGADDFVLISTLTKDYGININDSLHTKFTTIMIIMIKTFHTHIGQRSKCGKSLKTPME